MDWINANIQMVLFAWAISGILIWGWINYSIEQTNPEDNRDSVRWLVLAVAVIAGPLSSILVLIALPPNRVKLRMGLRFK